MNRDPKPLIQCIWFKRDFRVLDHATLVQAARRGQVLPVYLVEPDVMEAPDFDAMHWNFIRESLLELQQSLRRLGVELQVMQGDAVVLFESFRRRFGIERIWAHQETGNAVTYERDLAVGAWAEDAGVYFLEIPQHGVVRRLADRDGWVRQWEQRMSGPLLPRPDDVQRVPGTPTCQIPTAAELGLEETSREVGLVGGEANGLGMLQSFIKERGHRYQLEMSSPNTAYQSCSRLSPYLAWGCVSLRTVVRAVDGASKGGIIPKRAARSFRSRCHWHCHFMQKLESEPEIEFRAFNQACDDLRCGTLNEDLLTAWQEGRTGYPFVDACMRSLKSRGWINFRMRAMLVSFASYHLWIDWRHFKDWLACQFVDYEPGIHISQIQMQSGLIGINTLRIYNPVKQGQDQDAEGHFIRRWVPELTTLDAASIHEPWKTPELLQMESGCRIGTDYPFPIVDHKQAIRHARACFAELRKRDDYWESSRLVMERHGSRKTRESRDRPKRPAKNTEEQTELEF